MSKKTKQIIFTIVIAIVAISMIAPMLFTGY